MLPEIVKRLRVEEPKIVLEIVSTSEVTDILLRECDIAIRHVEPKDEDLIARKLPDQKFRLYYSKCLAKELKSKDDVSNIPLIGPLQVDKDSINRYLEALNYLGLPVTENNFITYSSGHVESWELVKVGVGIGAMHEIIGDNESEVVRFDQTLAPISMPTWLVTHRELHKNSRIRRVFDILVNDLVSVFNSSNTSKR